MKDDYKECNLSDALKLAVTVLAKSMDSNNPTHDKFEVGIMTKDAKGNLVQRRVQGQEL